MKILIILALIFLISCEDNNESENKYPLLEKNFPDRLIKEVRFLEGFCKEENNTNTFEFKDQEVWVWYRYNRNTGQTITSSSDQIRWKIKRSGYLNDRYDRQLPPNSCELIVEHDLNSNSFAKGKASCTRWISGMNIDSDSMENVTIVKDEDAFCSIKVTKRQNCFPDSYFEDPKRNKKWVEEFKYEACSSEKRDDYRKQTLMRWEDHKNSLEKNE